ncbi:MAG: DUF2029 domain-containing protein [Proteobacteria bacterium]|nr:DUF2029 domain-containing protein [Pseudomonadota bacterium]
MSFDRRFLLRFSIILVFLVFFIKSIYHSHFLYGERTDLKICWTAAQNLWEGLPVYKEDDLWAHTKPPFGTLLFLPLTKISFHLLANLWDALNIFLLFYLSFQFSYDLKRRFNQPLLWSTLLGVLLVINFWGYELRFGQYNLLTLFMIYMGSKFKDSRYQAPLFWAAFFIKPSNLIFLPWVLKKSKSIKEFFEASAISGVFLSGLYVTLFGWKALWVDHFQWLSFMKFATKKYLMREVNYGLPTLIGYITTSSWPQHLLLIMALFWGMVLVRKVNNDVLLFGLLAVLSLIVSPLTWWATFCIALPLHLYLGLRAWEMIRGRQFFRGIFLLLIIYSATQLIFPNFLPDFIMLNLPRLANPNWIYLMILIYVSMRKTSFESDYISGLVSRR